MYSVRKQIKVFISSATRELEPEREIAAETLTSMQVDPFLFELLPAMNDSPEAAFCDAVEESDIFIILLWKSLTKAVEQEYYLAAKKSKPILVLVKTLTENEQREDELQCLLDDLASSEKGQRVNKPCTRHSESCRN